VIIAISDIHGYADKLDDLMNKLERRFDLEFATLVYLGDYVDGGPDTKSVIDRLMQYERDFPHWVFLMGNHEDMLLDACVRGSITYGHFEQWWNQGGAETAASYAGRYVNVIDGLIEKDRLFPADHLTWLAARPLFHETDNFIFVHAGLTPGVGAGDTADFEKLWIRDQFINSTYDWGKRVIFGHTYTPEPIVMPNKIGIDTNHRGRGHLTAVVLDEDRPDAFKFFTSN
jgi:serine/threonine protein phosphatase 1